MRIKTLSCNWVGSAVGGRTGKNGSSEIAGMAAAHTYVNMQINDNRPLLDIMLKIA